MNPKSKVICGYILEFFTGDLAPKWQVIGPALKEYRVERLTGLKFYSFNNFIK